VPQEIERKFLVAGDAWRSQADGGRPLQQAYLAETERARQEFEYALPLDDAEGLIALRHGSVLEKTRFEVPYCGRRWEVDVYAGDNDGLVIAEIELESEAALVELPPWLGQEVTGDARYYASRLARNPFRSWPTAPRQAG
jgi:adenylate cyclase